MNYRSSIKHAALAAVAACGLVAVIPQSAQGGDFRIGINIGGNDHHRDRERTTVVYEYDSYCVGHRRNLYEADWQLRQAQVEEWHAYEALAAARQREGDLAVVVDDHEQLLADFNTRGERASGAVEEARLRLGAFERRAASARADVEASHVLHDTDGGADAEVRLRRNEAGAAEAARELRLAEEEAGRLPNRERMLEIKAGLPHEREDLLAAQDQVYNSQRRLDECVHHVAFALHDRDESLWLVYRDEIMTGRCDFSICGFRANAANWGGRMPRDPELVHERLVRPADYWLTHPAEMNTRIVEVDEIAEIHHMHDIQRSHERTYAEIERVELATPVERRRVYVEQGAGERDRIAAAKAEREAAAREHRPVRITAEERAVAIKNRADANAEKREARGEARAEETKARADARSEMTKARADAHAEETKSRADARSEQIRANADARAENLKARTDAKAETTKARADAKAEETKARADANAAKTEARTETRDERIKAQADAKAKQTEARADAKTREQQAREAKQQEEQAKRDAAKAQREAHNNKDSKDDKSKQEQSSTDPNAR